MEIKKKKKEWNCKYRKKCPAARGWEREFESGDGGRKAEDFASLRITHPGQQQPFGVFGETFHLPLHFQGYLIYFALFSAVKPNQTKWCFGVRVCFGFRV